MTELRWGLGLIAVAACANASFAFPMKLVHDWGCAQVLFGLAIDRIGMGLAFSIVLGISAAVGSLIPAFDLESSIQRSFTFTWLNTGVALVIAGVAVCGIAGHVRAKRQGRRHEAKGSFGTGMTMALVAGCCAGFMSIGVSAGAPLAHLASTEGAAAQSAVNAIWLPLLAAGAVPNSAYCLTLLTRRNSWRKYKHKYFFPNLFLAASMALLWFSSTEIYGIATRFLGILGAALGWPAFMSLIVVVAGLLGLATGEWKDSGATPRWLQLAGIFTLVLALVALSRSQAVTHAPASEVGYVSAQNGTAHVR